MRNQPNFVKIAQTMLTREEEQVLFDDWKTARDSGNKRVEDALFAKIITQFSPIVGRLVRKMRGYRLDPDDLMGEALIGLAKAAIDFDASRGFRFGTYASNCVMNTLYTFVTKQYFMSNVCANSKNKRVFFGLRRHMAQQIKETGHSDLTPDAMQELATALDVDIETIEMMNGLLRDPYSSLNQQVTGDNEAATLQDLLVSTDPVQEDLLEDKQLALLQGQLIEGALQRLDDRSREIMHRSVLVQESERATLEELGLTFSISKERVRQIRDTATTTIRTHIKHELIRRGFTPSDILPVE